MGRKEDGSGMGEGGFLRSESVERTDLKLGVPYLGTMESGGQRIALYAAEGDLGLKLFGKLSPDRGEDEAGFSIVVRKSDGFRGEFHESANILELCGDTEPMGQQMEHIAYVASESLRQRENKFTMHAAGVSKNGHSILLLGEKGGGKTSLALAMCRDYGWSLVGNDVQIVGLHNGQVSIFSGDGVFKVRKLGIGAELVKPGQSGDMDEFDTKLVIHPEDVGASRATGLPLPITRVVQVFLNSDSRAQLREVTPDPLATSLRLAENLARYVHGSGSPVLDRDLRVVGMIPSLDTDLARRNRSNFLNMMMTGVGVKRLAGGDFRLMAKHLDEVGEQ